MWTPLCLSLSHYHTHTTTTSTSTQDVSVLCYGLPHHTTTPPPQPREPQPHEISHRVVNTSPFQCAAQIGPYSNGSHQHLVDFYWLLCEWLYLLMPSGLSLIKIRICSFSDSLLGPVWMAQFHIFRPLKAFSVSVTTLRAPLFFNSVKCGHPRSQLTWPPSLSHILFSFTITLRARGFERAQNEGWSQVERVVWMHFFVGFSF